MKQLADVRKGILKQRAVEFKKLSRKPISIDQLPTPYKKTRLMQLLELRYKSPLESLIFTGTIYEAAKRLGVDGSTIYKWRKLVTWARESEFFEQFREEGKNKKEEVTNV